jgi:hypothetical protein
MQPRNIGVAGGQNQLPKVILGTRFTNRIEVAKEETQTAA